MCDIISIVVVVRNAPTYSFVCPAPSSAVVAWAAVVDFDWLGAVRIHCRAYPGSAPRSLQLPLPSAAHSARSRWLWRRLPAACCCECSYPRVIMFPTRPCRGSENCNRNASTNHHALAGSAAAAWLAVPLTVLAVLGNVGTGVAAALPVAPVACRDRLTWPFSQGSIWNQPIGSEAVYEPADIYPAPETPRDACAAGRHNTSQRRGCSGWKPSFNESDCLAVGCCYGERKWVYVVVAHAAPPPSEG